jgi:hypothetical protein
MEESGSGAAEIITVPDPGGLKSYGFYRSGTFQIGHILYIILESLELAQLTFLKTSQLYGNRVETASFIKSVRNQISGQNNIFSQPVFRFFFKLNSTVLFANEFL